MRLSYSESAVNDLIRLRRFIAENNPQAALETAKKLQQSIERLKDFPWLGKEVKSNRSSTPLRDLITGKYVIRYVILSKEIHILRVWHGREDR